MAKRKSPAERSQPDPRVTPQSIAAGKANLAKGRKKKADQAAEAKSAEVPTASARWRKLLDGSLTVRDLDDTEISKMRVRGADGGFSGRRPAIPSHLAQAMRNEAIRRAKESINANTNVVVKELIKLATDPDTKDSDRIKVLMYLADRQLGKTPEVVRVEGESKFDKMLSEAVGLDRDLDGDAGGPSRADA